MCREYTRSVFIDVVTVKKLANVRFYVTQTKAAAWSAYRTDECIFLSRLFSVFVMRSHTRTRTHRQPHRHTRTHRLMLYSKPGYMIYGLWLGSWCREAKRCSRVDPFYMHEYKNCTLYAHLDARYGL